jgi:hypothetical protein
VQFLAGIAQFPEGVMQVMMRMLLLGRGAEAEYGQGAESEQ